MAFLIPLFLFFISIPFSASAAATSELNLDYYRKTCPQFYQIVQDQVFTKQSSIPTTAAGVLRLFFHDCITDGCDASILISSNGFKKGERDADLNLSLAGDSFDIIAKIKNALELTCPGVVSCSDIMAQATRDLIKMVGGPFYQVPLGRKDSLVSDSSKVEASIPKPTMNMNDIIQKFTSKGFTVREMVALTGGHTIGVTHCKEFSHRIFNFSQTLDVDPTLHPTMAKALKNVCQNYTMDPTMTAFNDFQSPSTFDNGYYQNILKGAGLLSSDYLMASDPRTRRIVRRYAKNQTAFFKDFAMAMEKLALFGVKTGNQGEIRHRCDQFNHLPLQG